MPKFKVMLVALMLLVPALALASSVPCPCHKHTSTTHSKGAVPCPPTKTVYVEVPARPEPFHLEDGFGVTAGFRFDQVLPTPVAESKHVDPFFIGLEYRAPLSERFDVFGNLDRDFVQAPNWNARVGVSYKLLKDRY